MRSLLKRFVKSRYVAPIVVRLGRVLSFAGYRALAAADRPIVTEIRSAVGAAGTVWIDVGAHSRPIEAPAGVTLYAFEPTLSLAAAIEPRAGTQVIAAAVSDVPGIATFHLVSEDLNNSLLKMDAEGATQFVGLQEKRTGATSLVPVVRLDDFLEAAGIQSVDFLKVDTEGHDLAVLRSLGTRIRDVRVVQVETFEVAPYVGAENTVEAVTAFMTEHGFRLQGSVPIFFGQGADLTFERIGDGAGSREAG